MCVVPSRREILIPALRTDGGVLTGTHAIFNYVTKVATGSADKLAEISLKFYSSDYPRFGKALKLAPSMRAST